MSVITSVETAQSPRSRTDVRIRPAALSRDEPGAHARIRGAVARHAGPARPVRRRAAAGAQMVQRDRGDRARKQVDHRRRRQDPLSALGRPQPPGHPARPRQCGACPLVGLHRAVSRPRLQRRRHGSVRHGRQRLAARGLCHGRLRARGDRGVRGRRHVRAGRAADHRGA